MTGLGSNLPVLNLPHCQTLHYIIIDDERDNIYTDNQQCLHLDVGNNMWLKFEEVFIWTQCIVGLQTIKSNFKSFFKRRNGLRLVCNDTLVKYSVFLIFIFENTNCENCGDIWRTVCSRSVYINNYVQNITHRNSTEAKCQSTVFQDHMNLYNNIVSSKLFENIAITDSVDLPLDKIPTLCIPVRNKFLDAEWRKIQLFEWHFCKYCAEQTNSFGQTNIKKKTEFLNLCCDLHQTASVLKGYTSMYISETVQRKELANTLSDVNFSRDGMLHRPEVLEKALLKTLDLQCQYDLVCIGRQDATEDVIIIIESREMKDDTFNSTATEVATFLYYGHGIYKTVVLCVGENTLKSVSTDAYGVCRYRLNEKLTKRDVSVLHSKVFKFETYSPEGEVTTYCRTCYPDYGSCEPLSTETFDPVKEWFTQTPLPVQILLEGCFLNTHSQSSMTAEKRARFINGKLSKLQMHYDSLLHILNKEYFGMMQELNTHKLMLNINNASAVFEVTCQSGASRSLSSAEDQLKKLANPDRRHFEVFIKKYPMTYSTSLAKEAVCKYIGLTECHIVFEMDNLVRLAWRRDPNPGQKNSIALDTLPITLKGVPRDSAFARKWHKDECQDTNNCTCKAKVALKKVDMKKVLMELNALESSTFKLFDNFANWNIRHVLKALLEEPKLKSALQHTEEIQNGTDGGDGEVQCPINIGDDTDPMSSDLDEVDISLAETLEHLLEQNKPSNIPRESKVVSQRTPYSQKESFVQGTSTIPGINTSAAPPLLKLHPVPESGKDDDIKVLRRILTDLLLHLGYNTANCPHPDRILTAPDHKIARNLFKLMETNTSIGTYFLPEIPILHCLKSKIVTFLSAYSPAGILHLLKLITDEEDEKEWTRLASVSHIHTAVKRVNRLAASFQLTLTLEFWKSLEGEDGDNFLKDVAILTEEELGEKWNKPLEDFVIRGVDTDGTFALHVDMLTHMKEILAIKMGEKAGGLQGYALITAAIKESLPYTFTVNASSYAAFLVRLLIEDASCGHFHQMMKRSLFSHPLKDRSNCALDEHREFDHITAVKAFRGGSTLESVLRRMACIDHLCSSCQTLNTLISQKQVPGIQTSEPVSSSTQGYLGFCIPSPKLQEILTIGTVMLKQKSFAVVESREPANVYHPEPLILPHSILDKNSKEVGKYLMTRHLVKEHYFDMTPEDIPDLQGLNAHPALVKKVAKSKATTTNRVKGVSVQQQKTQFQEVEDRRRKFVKKGQKRVNEISSEFNTCLAIVQPDGSKTDPGKSVGIREAVCCVLEKGAVVENLEVNGVSSNPAVYLGVSGLPLHISSSVKVITVEAAGLKFRTCNVGNGVDYVRYVSTSCFQYLLRLCPSTTRIVYCEEKYHYTPDSFKAGTHLNRAKKQKGNNSKQGIIVSHLKDEQQIISEKKFDKKAVNGTLEGKRLASVYIAEHVQDIDVHADLILDIDSEHVRMPCACLGISCQCGAVCKPVRAIFSKETGFVSHHVLEHMSQNKGEAELSQIDWLLSMQNTLSEGTDAVISWVSSGDHDSIPYHIFAVGEYWPRNKNNRFDNPVYVVLQKPQQKVDIYTITDLVLDIETRLKLPHASFIFAVLLCAGGNDFLHKIHNLNHKKLITEVIQHQEKYKRLFEIMVNDNGKISRAELNFGIYSELVKKMFTPKILDSEKLSFEEVRQISIQHPSKKDFYSPNHFMPPKSALQCCANLINNQIEYMLTIGNPTAVLPNFLENGGLRAVSGNQIQFDLGNETKVDSFEELLSIPVKELKTSIRKARKRKLATEEKENGAIQKKKCAAKKMAIPKTRKVLSQRN